MENLDDVEFGSNKGKEEAPILVAQRYLNIFRQIHIFNKAKREEFDNELLALPTTITDVIKRMPGGRLLIEHIEDVKTERGIDFVKSTKDDFVTDTPTKDLASGNNENVVSPVVYGGGSIVADESFAQSLASALSSALAKNMTTPLSLQSASCDFSGATNAFDILAGEIQATRIDFQNSLDETRNIMDNIVASQISLSRILEKNLSLPQSTPTVSDSSILIEDKLRVMKKELRSEFETMLQMAVKSFQDKLSSIESSLKNRQRTQMTNTFTDDNSHNSEVEETSLVDMKESDSKETNNNLIFNKPVLQNNLVRDISSEESFLNETPPHKKKKKKKKKPVASNEDALGNVNRLERSDSISLSDINLAIDSDGEASIDEKRVVPQIINTPQKKKFLIL